MPRGQFTIDADIAGDALTLRWTDEVTEGSCRFDRLPGTSPEWLGSAEELLEGADRRNEGRILDAIAAWAGTQDLELGIWADDAGVEILRPR